MEPENTGRIGGPAQPSKAKTTAGFPAVVLQA
jgi:hypothetical protein